MFRIKRKKNNAGQNPLSEKVEAKLARFGFSPDNMDFLKRHVLTEEQLFAIVAERERAKIKELGILIADTLKASSCDWKGTSDCDQAEFSSDDALPLIICLAQRTFSVECLHPALRAIRGALEPFPDLLYKSFVAASDILGDQQADAYSIHGTLDGSIRLEYRLMYKQTVLASKDYVHILPIVKESDRFWDSVTKLFALRELDNCQPEELYGWLAVQHRLKSRQTS